MALKKMFALPFKDNLEFPDAYFRVEELHVNSRNKSASYAVYGYADADAAADDKSPFFSQTYSVSQDEFDLFFAKGGDYEAACYSHLKNSENPAIKSIGVAPVIEKVPTADGKSTVDKLVPQPNKRFFDDAESV